MNFLKKLFSSSEREKGKKYPGGSFLDVALSEAYRRLGDERIDDLYRASLLGGDVGARLMLAYDDRCLEKWGCGDSGKAVRLLEVWASTVVLSLLQHQEDQDSVLDATARGFAWLFNSDNERLKTELLAYKEANKADVARRGKTSWRLFIEDILYLRTLGALGDRGVPDLSALPVPWGVLAEVLQARPELNQELDLTIFTNLNNGFILGNALVSSLRTAQEAYDQRQA